MDIGDLSDTAVDDLLTDRRPSAHAMRPLVCFNFKVPLRVRRQFKIYAARHNMTMTEMLLKILAERLPPDTNHILPNATTKYEIEK
jgi:hypothetical protein